MPARSSHPLCAARCAAFLAVWRRSKVIGVVAGTRCEMLDENEALLHLANQPQPEKLLASRGHLFLNRPVWPMADVVDAGEECVGGQRGGVWPVC